jgi:CheY-like chemotaxis protein
MPTKVLVFESDVAFAGELRSELGNLGCTTTVVDDGNLGLQQAASEKPDLILLSIELPRMNGFSVCNKLKKDPNLKDVPLIIMSSESSDETFEQHKKLRTRAEDYVHKPVAFGELLQHIQGFVPLGATGHADGEGAIVIDDEIEVGATDYLLDDDDSQTMVVSSSDIDVGTAKRSKSERALKAERETVDADVDAFAESAFGRLTGPDVPPAPVAVLEAASPAPVAMVDAPASPRSMRNGSIPPAEVGQATARTFEAPAPPPSRTSVAPARPSFVPRQSVRPLPMLSGVEQGDHDKVREELARAKERLAANEREIEDGRQEIEKLRIEAGEAERLAREVDELKVRLSSGPKTTGVSSREFLDLREGLNKKDKEILGLREQLSKKDREIHEWQDKGLALERAKSDVEERLLALEREIAETRERNEALATDKDLAKKASEDFRLRLEKTRAESEGKDRQLNELRTKQAEERAANEVKLNSARAELDQMLANERAEQARELDEAEERRRGDLASADREHQTALAVVREQGEQATRDALKTQAADLRRESEAAQAALKREGEAAQATARRESEVALDSLRHQQDEQLSELRVEGERREQAALEALRAEHAEKMSALQNDRDSSIAALEAKSQRELGEANDKLARLDMDASALRGELQSLREGKEAGDAANASTIADLEKRLSEAKGALDDVTTKHRTASERASTLESDLAAARQDLGQTKEKLDGESSRANKAASKWEADKQSLERAKDALAVALAQIEDTEARPL